MDMDSFVFFKNELSCLELGFNRFMRAKEGVAKIYKNKIR